MVWHTQHTLLYSVSCVYFVQNTESRSILDSLRDSRLPKNKARLKKESTKGRVGWLWCCVDVWWHSSTPTPTPVVEYFNVIWRLGWAPVPLPMGNTLTGCNLYEQSGQSLGQCLCHASPGCSCGGRFNPTVWSLPISCAFGASYSTMRVQPMDPFLGLHRRAASDACSSQHPPSPLQRRKNPRGSVRWQEGEQKGPPSKRREKRGERRWKGTKGTKKKT